MKKRNQLLDFLRAFAIISVVFCHSIEAYYYLYQDRLVLWSMLSTRSKFLDIIGITIGRLGVPLFLFLTGILSTTKDYSNLDNVKTFYKKNYLSLFITLEIWVVLWNVFFIIIGKSGVEVPQITIIGVLENVLLFKTVNSILPGWYVPMILGLYLFLPFISIIIKKYNFKDLKIILIVGIIFLFLLPSLDTLGIVPISLKSDLYLPFFGGVFGLYVIIGKYVYDGLFRKINDKIMYLLAFSSFVLCIVYQFYCLDKGINYKLWYDNICLFVLSLSLLEIIHRKYDPNKIPELFKKVSSYLSNISFPIFLLHNVVQYIIYFNSEFIKDYNRMIRVLYIFILSMLFSFIVIELLKKSKFLSKYLLRIKG